jgi:hypothetical protein
VDRKQLLGEIDDVIRCMPERATIRQMTDDNIAWWGRASAVMQEWNAAKAMSFDVAVDGVRGRNGFDATVHLHKAMSLLSQASYSLRMETVGPLSSAVQQGAVFDYFDEVRKMVERASSEVLFVDPYLDAEFVSRYLPSLRGGVKARLLTQHCISALVPAVTAFNTQNKTSISVRSTSGMHDRYVFVDGKECFQSGASFKDGAKKAPTTLTQIVDAFDAVRDMYENKWASAKVEL